MSLGLAPIVGDVPIAVGANEFGPSGLMDFSVGDDGVVTADVGGCSVFLDVHADRNPVAANAETPAATPARRSKTRLLITSTPFTTGRGFHTLL